MKRATVLRGAAGRLNTIQHQRRFRSEQNSGGTTGNDEGHKRPDTGENELKINEQTKTVETPAGALPISPLMDPSWQGAVKRFQKPKLKANSIPKTRFRRQLEKNPYAQALATGTRSCSITGAVVPRFFLQDFHLLQHPETKKPFWVPTSLARSQAPSISATPAPSAQAGEASTPPAETPSSEAKKSTKPTKPSGPASYVLGRQDVFKSLATPGSAYFKQWRKLGRKSGAAQSSAVLNRVEWRPDMDTLVLELLRRRIVEDLLYVCEMCEKQNRKYLVKLESLEEVESSTTGGCVLRISPEDTSAGDASGDSAAVSVKVPEAAEGIPIYDLTTLLGSAQTARLRNGSSLLREGDLFLLGRRHKKSLEVQLKLWKLRGYLTQYDEAP